MEEIELVLGLLVVIALLATLARKIRVPYPIVLVLGGLALALVPGLPEIRLEPELVLLLFLPPILFSAAFFSSVRELKENVRPISLLALGLVLVTTATVAIVVHALVPEIGWAPAFALGAIVSPPDAVAVTAVAQRLSLPRRVMVILEGESLVNDATALVAYRIAVGAALTGAFSLTEAAGRFVFVAFVGLVVGLAVAWFAGWVTARLKDPPVEVTVSLLVPFAAYLPAEHLGASGVIAAVAAGVHAGWRAPRLMTSETRILGGAVWQMVIFFINGFVFLLIGLQLRTILTGLDAPEILRFAGVAVVVSVAVIVVRFAWVFPATYLPRLLVPGLRQRDPSPPWPHVVILAWAGMRGAVSLAAALALPLTLPGGAAFPHRELILFVTFGVIVATLVGQGVSLPWLIRALPIDEDQALLREETEARQAALAAAVERLEGLAVEWPDHAELIEQLQAQYSHRGRHSERSHDASEEADRELIEHRQIRHELIQAERLAVIDLRDRGSISDEVLRRVERELDLEELRMEA